jgi:lysophospholipase L1-like esterase/enterochelin esterase-like enzyme
MNTKQLLIIASLCFAATAPAAEDITFVADLDGSEQRYVQVLPAEFDAEQPADVLIALHGHGSDRWQFIRQDRDECRAVRDVARQREMILISPDYRATTSWMGPAAEADTLQIIARLKKEFRVRHVILCGASMGGASCLTFSALHPELVDGVASMNGTANHVEYANFQDAIRQSFGGTKSNASHEFRKRSAELWSHRFTMPSAFTVGGQDKSVPPHSVLRLAEQLKDDGRRTLLIHRESGGHSTTYADAVSALSFVLDQLVQPAKRLDSSALANGQTNLRLTLPTSVYAVAGTEMSIYFDNIVLTETPENYRFDVQCDLGRAEKRRWTVNPEADEAGMHELTVTVSHHSGTMIGRASTQLHVMPAHSGKDRDVSMLIVGDSLTHATTYSNELARLLSQPDNPTWKMFGTHRPGNAADGVRHEGYGGWTWQRFATKYEPNPDGTYRKRSSPFVFLDSAGKPQLDVTHYFDEATDGEQPDVAFFLLGINDCFGANPDDLAAIDARIDAMLYQAETLLASFREAAPTTDLAICITTPPNARESGFETNYKGRYHRWGWKRIQHRLVERLLRHFATPSNQTDRLAKGGRIYIVPTHLNLDPIDGYPNNNGVHPNATGYQQLGASLYCWLNWRMSETSASQ